MRPEVPGLVVLVGMPTVTAVIVQNGIGGSEQGWLEEKNLGGLPKAPC